MGIAQGANMTDQSFGSLFEEDYLIRNLGQIAHDPEIALTELVANAWEPERLRSPSSYPKCSMATSSWRTMAMA